MKRALIVYRVDRDDTANLGVVYKLLGQKNGLEAAGLNVDFIVHGKDAIFLSGKTIAPFNKSIYSKWKFYNYLDRDLVKGYDLYLFRYGLATKSFVTLLKDIKRLSVTAHLYIDMPTYPYHQEWTGWKGRLAMFIDHRWSSHLRKYVEGILHSGLERRIFDIPTIRVTNGIEISRVQQRTPVPHKGIRLLAIGKWRSWHGLDRAIKGMSNYVEEEGYGQVYLDIIGDGSELGNLRSLVNQLSLDNYVRFHGALRGTALNKLFDNADLGIGTLGLHRKGVLLDSSLKHREFVARGLPFIMAGEDVEIKASLPFVISIPRDDSSVDFSKVMAEIKEMDTHLLGQEMRSYAEDNLSWRSKMNSFLETIKGT